MTIKKFALLAVILLAAACCRTPGWAQPGKPVMYLPVSLLPENNILRVSWEPQAGVSEYTVEKWEIEGTGHWLFNINDRVKPGETRLKIGGAEADPLVFVHHANPGKTIEFYDQGVKPGRTYFYRVNGGIISAGETRKKPVVPLDGAVKNEIRDRQEAEQGEMDRAAGAARDGGRHERQKQYDRATDYPERLAADLIMALPNWLIEVIGLDDPLELVFGAELEGSFKIGEKTPVRDLLWNIYSREELRVISHFYAGAMQAVPVFMAAGVTMAGMLILFSAANFRSTITARGYILGILLCALLIKLGPYLLGFFFELNRALVALCHSVAADEIRQSFLHTIYNKETRSLGAALMALIGCLSVGVINFQFAVRKVFIAVLVGILPVVLINAIFPGRRNALAVWTREFASYVFMPAGLAVGLSFFIHFLNSGGFWITLVCLLCLPTINGLVRGALGLSDGGLTAGVGSALGMGAIFSLGGMLGGGREDPGRGIPDFSAGRWPGSPGDPGPVPAAGQSAAAPAGGGPGAAAGSGGVGAALGKGAAGIAGTLARGASGIGLAGSVALAGSLVSGAAGGDPLPGLTSGLNLGRAAASTLNGTGSSLRRFASEVREKGFSGATGIVDSAMLMDPGVTASLAARALGGNAVGKSAAAAAASASRVARAVSPLVAPGARERLDLVTGLVGDQSADGRKGSAGSGYAADPGREFENVRQMQNFRKMFEKIQDFQHGGGSGGINGPAWR